MPLTTYKPPVQKPYELNDTDLALLDTLSREKVLNYAIHKLMNENCGLYLDSCHWFAFQLADLKDILLCEAGEQARLNRDLQKDYL